VEDVLPKQTSEDDYNCGIGAVAAIGIMLRDVIGINQDNNFEFAAIFSQTALIVSFCNTTENTFVPFLRILSKGCHPLMRCQFLERLPLLF
jgi:hypothetical protein